MHKYPLPHGLNLIADAAGLEAAMKMALERGGSRFRIPKKASGSLLEEVVGLDAANKVVASLADERIEIPMAKKILALWLHEKGWSQEKIATALKVSRRTIQYWKAGNTPPRQGDLLQSA